MSNLTPLPPELFAALRQSSQLERKALAAKPTDSQLDAAFTQLRRSERGQQVLKDILALLDNGGTGLDLQNWEAVHTLLAAAQAGASHAVRDRIKFGRTD